MGLRKSLDCFIDHIITLLRIYGMQKSINMCGFFLFNALSWPLSPWERLGIVFVAGCHDAEVLRQSALPKNERVSAQDSAFASNSSLRPFNGKSNYLRTSTHRAKIRIKHNTKSFSCRDWRMIMNSIEGCNLCVQPESWGGSLDFPDFLYTFGITPVTLPLLNHYSMR